MGTARLISFEHQSGEADARNPKTVAESRTKSVASTIRDAKRLDDAGQLVREVVSHYRDRRHKHEQARSEAAADLGITPRRVKDYLDGTVCSAKADELARIAQGHLAHLEQQAHWLTNRAEQLLARRKSGST